MYNKDLINPSLNATELKKRLEEIQGEIRYISYTTEVLSREMRSLFQKLEVLSDGITTPEEEEFLAELMVAHE
jgi:archaellum component FlaC